MHLTARNDLLRLLRQRSAPCVSIYMPTHRSYPDRQQDPIRFRHLLDKARAEVRQRHPARDTQDLIGPFENLLKDDMFWADSLDGIAVLGSPGLFEVFDLQQDVPERVVVGDTFELKPLMRLSQSADRFHVLFLQSDGATLYEGTRDRVVPVHPAGVPLKALDDLLRERPDVDRRALENAPTGIAVKAGDAKMDVNRYYRSLDQAVYDHVSKPTGCPLVLAGLPELQVRFRSVTRNPQLLPAGIEQGPVPKSERELAADAWQCVEPLYQHRIGTVINDFHVALARGRASSDLYEVAKAISRSRVGVLLVEADRTIPGRFNPETGQLVLDDTPDAVAGEDVLENCAETVMRTDGAVLVLPAGQMPRPSGIAAIYRF